MVGLDFAVAAFLFLVSTVAALLAGYVATRRTGRRVRGTARIAVDFAVLGLLLVIIRTIVVSVLASYGWIFVSNRKLITLLLILAPAVVVPVAAVRLLRLVRGIDRDAPVPAEQRASVAAPRIVLHFQVTAFGAVAGFLEWFLPPSGSVALKTLLLGAILAGITGLLLLRGRGRSARLGRPDARLRASARTWLLRLGVTVVVLAALTGMAGLDMRASRFPDTFNMMSGTPDYGGGEPLTHNHIAGRHGSSVDTGQFTIRFTTNGRAFPDAPMHMVRAGELIRMRFVNRGGEDHPMHVHGHHFLALTKNGRPVTGSPTWLDTVNVRLGEIWENSVTARRAGRSR